MNEILTIIFIGIALSMDAFSLSLALGTVISDNKKTIIFVVLVGFFHFLMPLIGTMVGGRIVGILNISTQILMALILILIAFEMLKNAFDSEQNSFNLKIFGLILLALTVSFDSFSVGLGMNFITSKTFLSGIIFAIFSSLFTFLGICIGKYSKKHLGVTSNVLGAIILIVISIICLCQ